MDIISCFVNSDTMYEFTKLEGDASVKKSFYFVTHNKFRLNYILVKIDKANDNFDEYFDESCVEL